jgi:hypothetical protein
MATSQQFLVCDSSTLANFKQWAQAISGFFTTAGWAQSTDTGQVNWSTIVSVPGSGAFVYEVWQPNDGLTNFYVKMEYGNVGGTNCPSLRVTISTSTNGAGTATGFVIGLINVNTTTFTPPSTTTQYECDFSGAAGRIAAMMWRNAPNSPQMFFAIERSLNSSGVYTSDYITLWTCGISNVNTPCMQQSLVFGVGPAPILPATANNGGWAVRNPCTRTLSGAFNNQIPMDLCAPVVGAFGNQCTVAGSLTGADCVEGVTFSVTVYGSLRTYMPSKMSSFSCAGAMNSLNGGVAGAYALCMRYD